MSATFSAAQRAYDNQRPPWDDNRDAIEDRMQTALDDFRAGWSSVTSQSRVTAYDTWLKWCGVWKKQSWVNEQESEGYDRGVELAKCWVEDTGGIV